MKNQKILSLATIAGLAFGGLTVSVAGAQGYGDTPSPAPVTATATASAPEAANVIQAQRAASESSSNIVLVQQADVEADETEDEGRRGRHKGGCNLETAAEAIGIAEDDLKAAVENGQTIAEVAVANGVSAEAVIDAMVDAKAERIADKVEEGRIDQTRADEKLAELEDKIADRVNGVSDTNDA